MLGGGGGDFTQTARLLKSDNVIIVGVAEFCRQHEILVAAADTCQPLSAESTSPTRKRRRVSPVLFRVQTLVGSARRGFRTEPAEHLESPGEFMTPDEQLLDYLTWGFNQSNGDVWKQSLYLADRGTH